MKIYGKFLLLISLLLLTTTTYAIENTQDLVSVTKPAIVQVTSTVKGTIQIPNFVFEYDGYKISTTTKANGYTSIPVNTVTSGTGFIISEDGVIVTSSDIILGSIDSIYRASAQKYLSDINKGSQDSGYQVAFKTIYDHIKANSIAGFETDVRVKTYKANVLYSNLSSDGNQEHVALLKIEAGKLPTMSLSNQSVGLGQKVYTFGYPGMAVEPMFGQGLVNIIQGTTYQTDIQSFAGSKGSPLIDVNGRVIGILSDSITPSSQIQESLSSSSVAVASSAYADRYFTGLSLMNNNRCVLAIEEFTKAKDVNPDFSVDEYVQPKIDLCNSLIVSGQSRDTFLSQFIFMFKNNISNVNLWASVGILLVLVLLIFRYILKRFRRDEDELGISKKKVKIKPVRHEVIVENEEIAEGEVSTTLSGKLTISKPFEKIEQPNPLLGFENRKFYREPEKVGSPVPLKAGPAELPEESMVVIAPFKTLNSPITPTENDRAELLRDIKMDLPPKKKESDSIEK